MGKLWFPVQPKWSFECFRLNVGISVWFIRIDADVSVEPSAKVCMAHSPLQRPSQQDWSIDSRLTLFFSLILQILDIFFHIQHLLFHNLDKADTIYEKLYTQTQAGPHWLLHGSSQQKHNNLRFLGDHFTQKWKHWNSQEGNRNDKFSGVKEPFFCEYPQTRMFTSALLLQKKNSIS